MMKLLLLSHFLLFSIIGFAQNPAIDVQHYVHNLALTDENNKIIGETTIKLMVKQANLSTIVLDLVGKKTAGDSTGMTVEKVSTGNQNLGFKQQSNQLIIELASIFPINSIQTFTIHYSGIPADGLIISVNKFKERTFFGDNWPNRARYWLPVIDHPSDKATCEFIVTAPNYYKVIANGALKEESEMPNNQRLTHWIESTPIATKVMVIGVARFAVEQVGTVNCKPIQSWTYPQEREKVFFDYAPALKIIQFFDEKIGSYSYEKLANVQSKTKFGGMENASCIFYNEKAVSGVKSVTIESLLAHEIAHQWFGNSASEKDWPHIWLSEGFSTYFSALYLEHTYGKDSLNKIMATNKTAIFKFAAANPTATIVDTTTKELMQLLNANSYQKGAWVLHMLRSELGDEMFWRGIRQYYQKFRNSNANSEDFEEVMEKVSKKNLHQFFKQWLYQPAYPEIEWNWQYNEKAKSVIIRVKQVQATQQLFDLPLEFSLVNSNKKVIVKKENVDKIEKIFSFKMTEKPSNVALDANNQLLIKSIK